MPKSQKVSAKSLAARRHMKGAAEGNEDWVAEMDRRAAERVKSLPDMTPEQKRITDRILELHEAMTPEEYEEFEAHKEAEQEELDRQAEEDDLAREEEEEEADRLEDEEEQARLDREAEEADQGEVEQVDNSVSFRAGNPAKVAPTVPQSAAEKIAMANRLIREAAIMSTPYDTKPLTWSLLGTEPRFWVKKQLIHKIPYVASGQRGDRVVEVPFNYAPSNKIM